MSRIFVTGATGNIGSQIVQNLSEENADFVAGISPQEQEQSFDFATQVIDFSDKSSMVKAFQGSETLFLLLPLHPLMIDWAKNATDAAKEAGIKYIVRSSGAGANSQAGFKMPQVQGTIDDYIKTSGLNYTLVAPANFMQNFINFHTQDIKNGTIYMPTGEGKIGWVDVRDIAKVNAAVLQNPEKYFGQTLTVTGSENLNYGECVVIISEVIGKKVAFVDILEITAIEAMTQYQMPKFAIEMMTSLNQIIKAGYAEGTTNTVEEITGKAPISFRQFAEDYQSAWL